MLLSGFAHRKHAALDALAVHMDLHAALFIPRPVDDADDIRAAAELAGDRQIVKMRRKARIDAQANMLQVLSDWEVGSIETAAGGSQADLDEAYQGAIAQLAAKRDEGLAAIDATDDPDAVKQYWKQEVVEEHDVYLKSMQSSYDNAKAFLK